jgi:hypothetical protein
MPDKWVVCNKCGMKVNMTLLRKKDTRACLLCEEPLQELIEIGGTVGEGVFVGQIQGNATTNDHKQ